VGRGRGRGRALERGDTGISIITIRHEENAYMVAPYRQRNHAGQIKFCRGFIYRKLFSFPQKA